MMEKEEERQERGFQSININHRANSSCSPFPLLDADTSCEFSPHGFPFGLPFLPLYRVSALLSFSLFTHPPLKLLFVRCFPFLYPPIFTNDFPRISHLIEPRHDFKGGDFCNVIAVRGYTYMVREDVQRVYLLVSISGR